jgi:hypothetical protein
MHSVGQVCSTREINHKCIQNLGREARIYENLLLQNYLNISPENETKIRIFYMFHIST